jgi:ATP synthase protein I
MRKIAHDVEAEDPDEGFKPLTAEEARQLREKSPSVSPWRVIAGQVIAGILVALAAWGLTGRQNLGWSAAYGALSVVVPAAVFARGLTGRLSSLNPATAMIGFFVWEMVKMALTLAMLLAAPRLVTALSWPAMLVGLAVAMQAYWMALMFAPKRKN